MSVGIYKQKAADVMTAHVDSIHCGETIRDALLLMAKNRLTVLPVVNTRDECVGILSQSDLIEYTQDADEEEAFERLQRPVAGTGPSIDDLTSTRIEDAMTEKVVTVELEQDVVSVADVMLDQKIHHVPVVDKEGVLRGIISTMDILAGLRQRI